jgi:hypothetical protein
MELEMTPIPPQEVPLGHQPQRGAVFAGNVPFPAVWMGCLAFGAFLAQMMVTGGFQPDDGSLLEPWMLWPITALVFLVGLVSAGFGGQEIRRAILRRGTQGSHTSGPAWSRDYRWRHTGIADGSRTDLFGPWMMAAAWCLLLAPFVGFVFFPQGEFSLTGDSDVVPTPVRVMVGIFAVVGVLLVLTALREMVAYLWHGQRFLHFHTFPFLLGERLEATLRTRHPIGAERLTATLRCVAERHVWETGHGKDRDRSRITTEFEQLYVKTIEIELPDGSDSRRIPIAFDLPADAPATYLSGDPPRYWRVDVRLPRGFARFLVPVYSPPAREGGVALSPPNPA